MKRNLWYHAKEDEAIILIGACEAPKIQTVREQSYRRKKKRSIVYSYGPLALAPYTQQHRFNLASRMLVLLSPERQRGRRPSYILSSSPPGYRERMCSPRVRARVARDLDPRFINSSPELGGEGGGITPPFFPPFQQV